MAGEPTIVQTRTLHSGKKYDYVELTVRPTRGGMDYRKQMVRHPGAVVIVPVLDDGRVVLIGNYRVSVARFVVELPAGTLERGEVPEVCARRELIEEAGYEAGEVVGLGWFYTSPGLTDEKMYVVGARGLVHVGQSLEEYEDIEVVPTKVAEVLRWIDEGQIVDAKTIAALMLGFRKGFLKLPAGV